MNNSNKVITSNNSKYVISMLDHQVMAPKLRKGIVLLGFLLLLVKKSPPCYQTVLYAFILCATELLVNSKY